MNFTDMNLIPQISEREITIGNNKLNVKSYLAIDDKANFIEFIVNGALDDNTGCFSPLRVEVYYGIALCRWYADIMFTEEDLQNISTVYDILETNHVIDYIESCIEGTELNFIQDLVKETIADISRYNSSAAGIIQMMSTNASGLDGQLNEILASIKNSEGLEQLSAIKDVVGKD